MNSEIKVQKSESGEIRVSFVYNPVFVEKIKAIKEHRWHPEGRCWSFPNSNGTDLRYIQELLGHKSSKTTEIYTHVSNKALMKIRNPLDEILRRGVIVHRYGLSKHCRLSLQNRIKSDIVAYERVMRHDWRRD